MVNGEYIHFFGEVDITSPICPIYDGGDPFLYMGNNNFQGGNASSYDLAMNHMMNTGKPATLVWNFAEGGQTYMISQSFEIVGTTLNGNTKLNMRTKIVNSDGVQLTEAQAQEFGFTNLTERVFVNAKFGFILNQDVASCFLSGTPITTADGSTKPIEEIKLGDRVLSYDESGALVSGEVTRIFENEVEHIIDVFGLKMTPGHVTYCADGPLKNQHVTMLDILRSDGAIMRADGTKIRATTGCALGSPEDKFVQAVVGEMVNGDFVVRDQAAIRIGTRMILENGNDVSVGDIVAFAGAKIVDGWIAQDGQRMPFHWCFGDSLPKPEDYILSRSKVTLDAIYQAGEWIDHAPSLGAGTDLRAH